MTPAQLAKSGTEDAHQVALFCHVQSLLVRWPVLRWLHAIPNGGDRNPAVAGRLKVGGVKRGVPDIFLPVAKRGYHGLYIELKKPGREKDARGGLSVEQDEFKRDIEAQGYAVIVCYGWEQAAKVIEGYMSHD